MERWLQTELSVFLSLNPDVDALVHADSESEALRAFLADSCELIVLTRDLYPEEIALLEAQAVGLTRMRVARGGAMLFSAAEWISSDDPMHREELRRLLIDSNYRMDTRGGWPEALVFPHRQSSLYRLLCDSILGGLEPTVPVFGLSNEAEAAAWLRSHPEALGFLPMASAADRHDTGAAALRTGLHLLGLKIGTLADSTSGLWPLIQDIWLISREEVLGPASGFVTFARREQGQRITRRMGLQPMEMPGYAIELRRDLVN
jgi:DNA-binding NarL/FixJ family response regulator